MIPFKTLQHRLAAPTFAGALGVCILLAPVADALAGDGTNLWERKSHVSDTVMDNGNGTWTYDFTVHNDSFRDYEGSPQEPFIVDWELPYFDDAGFDDTDVFSPAGWSAKIETVGIENPATGWGGIASWQDPADPFYFGPDSPFTTTDLVLHWYSECWAQGDPEPAFAAAAIGSTVCEGSLQDAISPGSSLNGFGFTADYDRTDAPYQASWALLPVRTGDPAFPLGGLPASPQATAIPEPETLALALLGLAGGIAARRRARKGER